MKQNTIPKRCGLCFQTKSHSLSLTQRYDAEVLKRTLGSLEFLKSLAVRD